MTDEYTLGPVVNLNNQAVGVAFNVKDSVFLYRVRRGVCLTHISNIPPLCLLCNSEPCVKRALQISMSPGGLLQLLPTDNMHDSRLVEPA